MKLAIILGTRPEIIKLAPVIRACQELGEEFIVIHSGQHYSPNMDKVFFEELELPEPEYQLELGKLDYRRRVGTGMRELKEIYDKEKPDVVVVEGDTMTVLLGALAANKNGIPIAHVEAGLRSHDLTMPEEVNRILTDHISTYLFPPTEGAATYLKEEGLGTITPIGNTVVDAVQQNLVLAEERSDILETLGVAEKQYILVTAHRQENVDDEERLRGILNGIDEVAKEHPEFKVLYPIHPRTDKMMKHFRIPRSENVQFIEPVGYLDFLRLQQGAKIILTDSGGIQEEASILHVPCVTLRDNTERPETVEAGVNVLAGADPEKILSSAKDMLKKDLLWTDLYGDGTTGKQIIEALREEHGYAE